MAKNRVVLTFSATPGGPFTSLAGWSETLWRNVDESPDTLLNAICGTVGVPPTIPYLIDRRNLMTEGWRIDGVKVYPITGGRISSQKTIPGSEGKGLYLIGASDTQQQPYDRLMWKMNASGGHSRACRLGGISSDIVDPGGNYTSPVLWNAEFYSEFVANLVTAQFGLRYGTLGVTRQILDLVFDNTILAGSSPRTPALVVDGNRTAQFQPGTVVRVSGVNGTARANGQWTVDRSLVDGANTNVFLRAKRTTAVSGAYDFGGYVVDITYAVAAMTSGNPVRGVSRKAGRPSGLPRGRRSNRR